MKKIIIILLIAITSISIKAQEQTFSQMFDDIFQNISRLDAATGILYDRILPLSSLRQFSGSNPDTATGQTH